MTSIEDASFFNYIWDITNKVPTKRMQKAGALYSNDNNDRTKERNLTLQ